MLIVTIVDCPLQRVLMQITQELCKRPGLNKTGFDIPTIYIPNLTGKVNFSFEPP